MDKVDVMDGWDEVVSFLPTGWEELARESGALKGLRQDKSAGNLLRTLLMHCGCGMSLKSTIARAKLAGFASMSHVALFHRLMKSEDFLKGLCEKLFAERGVGGSEVPPRLRVVDATHVSEPGKTGSEWRVHYSLCLSTMRCDHFSLTPLEGKGNGESFRHIPVNEGDMLLADRGYCRATALAHVAEAGASFAVRWHHQALPLLDGRGDRPFGHEAALKRLRKSGDIGEWPVAFQDGERLLHARLCAIRKTREAEVRARKECLETARRHGYKARPETLFLCRYTLIVTTFSEEYHARDVLNLYRMRWQVELVFKRFKQSAGLGALPKSNDASSRAWLYGCLLYALLTEKILALAGAGAFSPWRDSSEVGGMAEREEGIRVYVVPNEHMDCASHEPEGDNDTMGGNLAESR
jgi:hypothetical protein